MFKKNVIDETGAVIVMSSAWKLWFDVNMMPIEGYSQHLYDIFSEFGIKIFAKLLILVPKKYELKRLLVK